MRASPREPHFSTAEARLDLDGRRLSASREWLDDPMIVSIETFTRCNAACDFCPYSDLSRKGSRMPREQVLGLIDEVADFARPPARLNLTRVNEPFLDVNIFDYLAYAAEKLPKTALILFTNGQPLTDRVVDRLDAIPTFTGLTVSFNEHDPETYARVMRIDQAKTLRRLDALHARAQTGSLRFKVALSRVGTSDARDDDFRAWCAERFPAFTVSVSARFDWIGDEAEGAGVDGPAPNAGCAQWYSLHVLADGNAAFCCIDGRAGDGAMNISSHSLAQIYNDPAKRRLREAAVSRRSVKGCENCVHGMPADAYRPAEVDSGGA